MRNFIDIVAKNKKVLKETKKFEFFQQLNEAKPPRRRMRDISYEPEPEPEDTLHGDINDTIENGRNHLNNLMNNDFGSDDISDQEAIHKAGQIDDDEDFADFLHRKSVETGMIIPTLWRQIKNLPNYILNNIRQMGRMIFRRITDTPLDDIFVIANAFGDSDRDVRNMIEWLQKYGIKEEYTPFDFSNMMPGYKAKQMLYGVDDYQFLIVRDAHGMYVYSWKKDR